MGMSTHRAILVTNPRSTSRAAVVRSQEPRAYPYLTKRPTASTRRDRRRGAATPQRRSLPHTTVKPRTLVHDTTSSVTAVDLESGTHCAVRGGVAWKVEEGRSRSGVPQEVRPVVPVTTSSPRFSFRARSSHCQVLALPQSQSRRRNFAVPDYTGGSPPHDFRAYVDVPVFGARCVTQV